MIMKRAFLLILICLFITTSYSQTYNFSFSIFDFSIEENDNEHIIKHPSDFEVTSNTCNPILPSCVKNILLPPNKKVNNVIVDYTKMDWQSNIILKSMPMMHPIDGKYYSDELCYYALKTYPDSIVRYSGISTVDNYRYASFVITPFIYNATNGTLAFVSQVNITLELVDTIIKYKVPTQDKVIKQIVHNPNDIDLYYQQNKSQNSTEPNIDYLIITVDSLKNDFEPLRIWKTQKGVYTKIITMEEINATYNGATPQLRIKQCVQDYYDNYGLKWLLLGGDDNIVPIFKVPMTIKSTVRIPADIFYGCLDGAFDWDANGNGIIGEDSDNVSLNQVINISRLPINTKSQVTTYIDKILKYEKNPEITNPSMLICAQKLWRYENETGYSDAHLKSNIFVNNHINPYWNGDVVRFYDTYTDFPEEANYDLITENITTQLNQGYDFLHFSTHGSPESWTTEDGHFTTNNAIMLSNEKPTVVITMSCSTNSFDGGEPCLSEAFIRQPVGGAIVYWGSSREGWGTKSFYGLGPSFTFSADFFEILFSNITHHFSEIVKLVKLYNLNNALYNEYYRWITFSNNAIGDAELPIFTTTPNEFQNISIDIDQTDITVNTGGIDSCTITMSNINNGGNYFATYKNVSTAVFENVPDDYTIVITKDNFIPYIIELDCLIATEIISDNKIVAGCKNTQIGLVVGNNPTSQTQIGTNNIPSIWDDSTPLPGFLGMAKITSTGKLVVHNGGIVTIKRLTMSEGSELYIRNE